MGLFDNFDNDKKNDPFGLFKENKGYDPAAWRKNIPQNDVFDSHIWDYDVNDRDGDGYRDGSVGDGGLWDD